MSVGVVDEVGDDALHPASIRDHRGTVAADQAQRQVPGGQHCLDRSDDVGGIALHGGGRCHAGYLEQVEQDAREPTRLPGKCRDESGLPRAEALAMRLEELGGRHDGRHRGPQLVTDVGDESALPLDARGDGDGHLVEGVRDRVEVGVAGLRQPHGQVSGSQLPGTRAQPLQWPQQPTAQVAPTAPPITKAATASISSRDRARDRVLSRSVSGKSSTYSPDRVSTATP